MSKILNIADLGCKQRVSDPAAKAANAANNRTIIEKYLNLGKVLHVPAGDWDIAGTINVTANYCGLIGEDRVKSRIYQVTVNSNTLKFNGSKKVMVRKIGFIGQNYTEPMPNALNTDNDPLYFFNGCEDVRVEECEVSGFPVFRGAVVLEGVQLANVKDNLFMFNEDAGKYGCDILVRGYNQTAYVNNGNTYYEADREPARKIIITGNQCLSNNNVGIGCLQASQHVIVSNNICVASDQNQNEYLTQSAGLKRKEGITMVYNISQSQRNQFDQFQSVCDGNIIKNTRWSGIYCNINLVSDSASPGASLQPDKKGGYNGVISNNRIDNVCGEESTGQGSFLQNGISVLGNQGMVISNNVISRVRGLNQFNPANGGFNSGINCSSEQDLAEDTDGRIQRGSIICEGNHISLVDGVGLFTDTAKSPVSFLNNHVVDCKLAYVRTTNTTTADIIVQGNMFWCTGNQENGEPAIPAATYYMCQFEHTGYTQFHNNTVKFDIQPTNTKDHTMIYFKNENCSIQGNHIRAPLAEWDGNNSSLPRVIGMRIGTIGSGGRNGLQNQANNVWEGFEFAMWSNTEAANVGPYIISGDSFVRCRRGLATSSNGSMFFGRWLCHESTTGSAPNMTQRPQTVEVVVNTTNPPSTALNGGSWVVGDRFMNQDELWVCTSAGTPGTWTKKY